MPEKYVIPSFLTGEDIRTARFSLKMTQKEFAAFLGCSVRTVEHWESRADKITGPVVPLLEILLRKPSWISRLMLPEKRLKMRLWYMYRHVVCTIIDVDVQEREIIVTNYVDNPLYRAFGVNPAPDYEDYEAFLQSRCFPPERDKIKLELEALGIPFYDPLLIIEKTEGRMAEDHFWLKVERNNDRV